MDDELILSTETFYNQEETPIGMSFTVKKPPLTTGSISARGFAILACFLFNYLCWPSRTDGRWTLVGLVTFSCSLFVTILVFFKSLCYVHEETVLLTVPISLQLTTYYTWGFKRSIYIPWHKIKDLAILEVITYQKVLFYLAVLMKQDKQTDGTHTILFEESAPRLHFLEYIYKRAQGFIDHHRLHNNKYFLAREQRRTLH